MRTAALLGVLLAGAALVALWLVPGSGRRAGDFRPVPREEPASVDAGVELFVPERPADEAPRVEREEPAERASEIVARPTTRQPIVQQPSVRLHVRGRTSGQELASVFVIELEHSLDPTLGRPTPAHERAENKRSSPVHLAVPGPGEEHTIFARSPGYAWGRIDIGSEQPERFLDLETGGDLHVRVVGGPRDPGTKLRVFMADPRPLFEVELHAADEVFVSSLPDAIFEVAAQLGRYEWARTLASASAPITAGATTSVTLALEPVEPARWVPLAGSLVLPPEWELDDFQLLFQLEGPALERWPGKALVASAEMTLADRAAGIYRWDARDVQPGVYAVALPELGYGLQIVVGTAGARDVRIEVGPPCDVRLSCVLLSGDAEAPTREPTGTMTLQRSSGLVEVPKELVPVTGWSEALACFEFRAPAGRLRIVALEPPGSQDFELQPGLNELEFAVTARTSTGVRLTLVDDAGVVPWDLRRVPELHPLTGGRSLMPAWSVVDRRLELRVEQAGSYWLRLSPIAGYEPVPELTVELELGVLTDLVIELVRIP